MLCCVRDPCPAIAFILCPVLRKVPDERNPFVKLGITVYATTASKNLMRNSQPL